MHLLLLFVWFSATLSAPVVPLHGSQGPKIQDYTLIGPMPTDTIINFSLVLVSRGNAAWKHHVNNATGADFQNRRYTNKAEFNKNHNHTDHAQPISSFARRSGFTLLKFSPLGDHRIPMSGSVGSVNKAFNTTLSYYQGTDGAVYRGYEGILYVQQDIHSRIATVLGLNNFTKFTRTGVWTPMDTTKRASSGSLTANKIAAMYNFPTGFDGTGQCIGIVELGGAQNASDLRLSLLAAGITQIPQVTAVTIDGFTQDSEASSISEVALDIQVIAAIAPGAKIVVYYAPNHGQGTYDLYSTMINDVTSCGNGNHFTAISSSWGSPEVASSASRNALNEVLQKAAAYGITITVAAGDHGSSNGNPGTPSVLWPAASDWVLACGGTAITVQSGKITDEKVWNSGNWGSGGGISSYARPSWQSQTYGATTLTGRGVPDVSAMADGNSVGFAIQYNGKMHSVGGTSGVAPLWAAFVALMNQMSGKRVGLLNPIIYGLSDAQRSTSFRDITKGNNQVSTLDSVFYSAQPGWDACTGWGSPKNATNLMEAILGTDFERAQSTAPAAPVVTSVPAMPVTDSKSTAQVHHGASSSGTPGYAIALIVIGCLVMTTLFVLLIVAIKRAPEKERF